jgi:hypothetical protein
MGVKDIRTNVNKKKSEQEEDWSILCDSDSFLQILDRYYTSFQTKALHKYHIL